MREDDALEPEKPQAFSDAPWDALKGEAADGQPTEEPRDTSGRFGSGAVPVEPSEARPNRRKQPTVAPVPVSDRRGDEHHDRRKGLLFAGAFLALVLIGGGLALFLGASDTSEDPAGPSNTDPTDTTTLGPTFPSSIALGTTTTTDGSGITIGTPDPEVTIAVTLPTVLPPPSDATVPLSPGRIIVETPSIDFNNGSESERLRLFNDGGGEANWQVSVGAGSGLKLSAFQGRLRPGETIEIEIELDRDAGPNASDWSVNLLVLGGGQTAPSNVRVRVFPAA